MNTAFVDYDNGTTVERIKSVLYTNVALIDHYTMTQASLSQSIADNDALLCTTDDITPPSAMVTPHDIDGIKQLIALHGDAIV
jgi:hypothetical protein